MYNAELQIIFDGFTENFVEDPDFLINFYETNDQKLSSVNWFDHEALLKYESIAGWYLWALMQQKKYSKAREQANAILRVAERHIANLKIDPATDYKYHNIIKQRAYGNYYRFQFRAAAKDFLRLAQYDPQNKNYKLWAGMSLCRFYAMLLYCLSALIIFGNGYYKKYLSLPFAIAAPVIGILCAAAGWWFETKAKGIWKNSQPPVRKI